ncbi:MAG TPA: L,D-transpeptidase family protein [Verrucomicrobiae bacterium]|jgi:D-alanyl-D-alanine dipeptidase|nr:L,D-transpeptidase family protein [Verrucomicrobiae bacterium]
MRKKIISLVILFELLACVGFSQTNAALPSSSIALSPLTGCKQVLLVTTADWPVVTGTMRRFVRTNAESSWIQVGESIPVVVGRNGLGWGRGLNAVPNPAMPAKHEGDGKSPAGIFRLSSAFGLLSVDKVAPLKLPYEYLTNGIECVDDVKSAHYNSIVDRAQTQPVDWNSSEKMNTVAQYRLGVVVEHNTDPREPGGGSCIFIHTWAGPQTGTSGCTAMASENIDTVVPWLDPADAPVLVQLPEAAYRRWRVEWELPQITKF